MDKRTYQRMVAELWQLKYRIEKLSDFMETDIYLALSLQERQWMNEQLNAMKWYYSSLKKRVVYYKEQEASEKWIREYRS